MPAPPRLSRTRPLDRPVQSFDVFDTCLVRAYLHPDDLIYDCVERVLATRPGRPPRAEEVSALTSRRISVHRRLLGESSLDEVRLVDVYGAMGDLSGWGLTSVQLHDQELALEHASARPVAAMVAQIAAARWSGQRVMFLSDMWLPEKFVRQLLLDAGVATEGDLVRVSCESGKSKWTGRLFHSVLSEQGLHPEDVHHRGDNSRTDYDVPRSLGIAATLVLPTKPSRYEAIPMLEDGPRHVRSRLAGASRSVRLSYSDPAGSLEEAASGVAAGVAGPLITAFVSWVVEQAGDDGVEHLCFAARDGQIMHKVGQVLLAGGGGPRLSYLEVSRKSLLFAGLRDTSLTSLEQVLPPPSVRSPRRALAAVGLSIDDLAREADRCGLPSPAWDQPVRNARVAGLDTLLKTPAVQQQLEASRLRAREAARGYLRQHGLLNNDDWALVDIGWNLRLQRVLRDVCGRTDDKPLGYYLGARPEGVELSRPGPYRAFLHQGLHDAGRLSAGALIFSQHTVVEALLTPGDHGSVQGYTAAADRWVPEHGPIPDEPQARYVARLHEGVIRYAREAVDNDVLPRHLAEARAHAMGVTALFLGQPVAAELRGLHGLRHADDVSQEVTSPIVDRITLLTVTGAVMNRLQRRPRPAIMWKAGSLAISSRAARQSVVLLGRLPGPRLRVLKERLRHARRR